MTLHERIVGFLSKPYLLLLALAWLPAVCGAQNANDGFDPDANNTVLVLAVQADGRTLVGGDFTQIGFNSILGHTRVRLARLNVDGDVDTDFASPDVDSTVQAIAVQADGRVVIGGAFTHVGGYMRNHIARLNTNGSVDTSFDPNANDVVRALAVQPDGTLVVGGDFTSLAPPIGGAFTRNHIARLNADGSVDIAFDPNANGGVYALALQSDGKLMVGGYFLSLSPSFGGAFPRHYIARLNVDGSVDMAFDPNANALVRALVLLPDGKLVLGGYFTSLAPPIGGAFTRNHIARLNTNGSVDTAFDPNANDVVLDLALQPDGKLVVGGFFTSLAPPIGGAFTRHYIARLNIDGSVDVVFNPLANSSVRASAVQPDGKLVVGGSFTSLEPNLGGTITRNHIARLNADGSMDTTLNPSANGYVIALALQPDGKLVVGGNFTSLSPNGGVAIPRNHIARLNADGSLDMAFNPNAAGGVYALVLQPDGKLVVGGDFTSLAPSVGGAFTRNRIARLNTDGSVDTAFDPNADSGVPVFFEPPAVYALALQPDGKLVVGGNFITLSPNGGGAIPRNHIARLNADGSVDSAFDPNANGNVDSVAVQPDGKLVVGGGFGSLSANFGDAITRRGIARLNADGSVDTAFDPNANGSVLALALQPDGKLVLGGEFTSLSPSLGPTAPRNRIARLNADGSLDMAFDPNADGAIDALALQPDGKLVVGGVFSTLSPPPNGGGAFTRNNIARLNADGSLDMAFDAQASNNGYDFVAALAMQPDGKLVVGGSFASIGGQVRNSIARFSTPQAALQSLNIVGYSAGGSTVTWTRAGAGPELALPPQLQIALDASTYAPVCTMQRVSSGWRCSGVLAPLNQKFYLRTRGQVSSGQYNGSGGLIESTRQFYLNGNDGIFANGFD